MKEFAPANIRNIAILGHQDVGKTILAEAMLFASGAINRIGRIEDGNTTMDFATEETSRQISVHSGVAWCEHNGTKINIIDTPGYEDFVGDVVYSLDVVDAGIVVVRADSGVEVGTDKVFGMLRERSLPAMILINKMDKEHANFDHCVEQIQETFGPSARIFHVPIGTGESFRGIVDLVTNKAYEYARDGKGTRTEIEIPADMAETVRKMRIDLLESAAETDEALMEKYLDGGELTEAEFQRGIAAGVRAGGVFPILCGSSVANVGASLLMDAIVALCPTAEEGTHAADGETVKVDPSAQRTAFVFKNISDAHVGDMLLFRVYGGAFGGGVDIHNTKRNVGERLGQLSFVLGKVRQDTERVGCGDIGAVVKLRYTKVGDTLGEKNGIVFTAPALPRPSIFSAIHATKEGDDDKMGTGLNRLHDEDPAFEIRHDAETHQTLISGQGELHLDIVTGKLKERFGVEVVMEKPRIPYRETIARAAEAQGRHKKQTGGRGQFGDVWLKLEPMKRGEQFEFVDGIVGGVVPNKFIPAVEKGVRETMSRGVIAGYPMVDIRVTLYDGSYHAVDSSEQAFKTAASIGFKAAIEKAHAVLLEPILNVKVKVPEDFMGDVMGDLSGRRGKIQGTEPSGKFITVNALVPQSELYRYSTHLRSMTHGRGSHLREFSHYEQIPHDQQAKVVEESKKAAAER